MKALTPAAIPQEPTPDLNPETLQVLSNLMIAQAQEIFVVKAIRGNQNVLGRRGRDVGLFSNFCFLICSDNMKDGIVAKLACQCEELYAETLRGLQKDSMRSIWDKEWIPTVSNRQHCVGVSSTH